MQKIREINEYYIIYGSHSLLAKYTTQKDTLNQKRNIARVFDTAEKFIVYLLQERFYSLYTANNLIKELTEQNFKNWTAI